MILRFLTKHLIKTQIKKFSNYTHLKPPWKVLFFGSDPFSLESLKLLYSEYSKGNLINRLEVVTSKGKKLNHVEKFATEHNLTLLTWPPLIDSHAFHVGIIVSFGHLIPTDVINKFPMGMLNVHGSLLPRWRGAAPIVYALANGDTKTGVTIMQIKPDKFDVGDILQQREIPIAADTMMPELYEKLAHLGAAALIETLQLLPDVLTKKRRQSTAGVTYAPKIDAKISKVCWDQSTALDVYNLRRALEGIAPLTATFETVSVKLFNINQCDKPKNDAPITPGLTVYNKDSKLLEIQCSDGRWISVERIGVPGKKPMSAVEFKNGYLKNMKDGVFILR